MRSAALTLGLFLAGCIPRTAVVHDGFEGTVLDAETRQPLAGAFVFNRIENGLPHILARSDVSGQLHLEPDTRIALASPLGEAWVLQTLWVCKEGYTPVRVGGRSGWNADYSPGKYLRAGTIALTHSALDAAASCSQVSG